MSQKKISELTSTSKLNDDNIIPLVQDGVTKHIRYGDMKSPMVKEVEANVEDYVDSKINTRVNYAFTSMLTLGFTKGSYVSVRDFWYKLANTIGVQGVIQFNYYTANAAYVGTSAKNAYLVGGTLIYSCSGSPASYGWFTAIYCSAAGGVYEIRCTMSADTTAGKEYWTINQLAYSNDMVETQKNLSNLSDKVDLMYQYNGTPKTIGKWHDGRNIMRLVLLPKEIYGIIGGSGVNKIDIYAKYVGTNIIGINLSAKAIRSNGSLPIDLTPSLHEDSVNGNRYMYMADKSLLTENMLSDGTIDCVLIEYVQK